MVWKKQSLSHAVNPASRICCIIVSQRRGTRHFQQGDSSWLTSAWLLRTLTEVNSAKSLVREARSQDSISNKGMVGLNNTSPAPEVRLIIPLPIPLLPLTPLPPLPPLPYSFHLPSTFSCPALVNDSWQHINPTTQLCTMGATTLGSKASDASYLAFLV